MCRCANVRKQHLQVKSWDLRPMHICTSTDCISNLQLLHLVAVQPPDGNFGRSYFNVVVGEGGDFVDGDNKRAMDADKQGWWQYFFHGTDGLLYYQGLALLAVNLHVILQAFNVHDFFQEYFHHLTVGPEIKETLIIFRCIRRNIHRLIVVNDLVYSAQEPFERDWLEQVVYRVQLERICSVFFVGGRKDHLRGVLQGFDEADAGKLGHVDVEKDQVYRMFLQHVHRLESVGAGTGHFQLLHVIDIFFQYPDSGRFIIYQQAFPYHNLQVDNLWTGIEPHCYPFPVAIVIAR